MEGSLIFLIFIFLFVFVVWEAAESSGRLLLSTEGSVLNIVLVWIAERIW